MTASFAGFTRQAIGQSLRPLDDSVPTPARLDGCLRTASGRPTTFLSAEGRNIRAGVTTFQENCTASRAASSTPQAQTQEWPWPKGGGSVLRSVALGSGGARKRATPTGLAVRKHGSRVEPAAVVVLNSGIGRAQCSGATTSPVSSAANVAAICKPITSSRIETSQNYDGTYRMAERCASLAITPHSEGRRKPGELGESPTGLTAEGNAEPSRRMKYAGGRRDGQSVPRIGMRLTSARRAAWQPHDDMTSAAGEPAEREIESPRSQKPRSAPSIRPCSRCSARPRSRTSRPSG